MIFLNSASNFKSFYLTNFVQHFLFFGGEPIKERIPHNWSNLRILYFICGIIYLRLTILNEPVNSWKQGDFSFAQTDDFLGRIKVLIWAKNRLLALC